MSFVYDLSIWYSFCHQVVLIEWSYLTCSVSLTIHPYCLLLLAGPLDYIQCLHSSFKVSSSFSALEFVGFLLSKDDFFFPMLSCFSLTAIDFYATRHLALGLTGFCFSVGSNTVFVFVIWSMCFQIREGVVEVGDVHFTTSIDGTVESGDFCLLVVIKCSYIIHNWIFSMLLVKLSYEDWKAFLHP